MKTRDYTKLKTDGVSPEWRLVTHWEKLERATKREINLIVVHCSATKIGQHYTPQDLIADHKQRGFTTAGYHYYVMQDGLLYALCPAEMVGAHARGHNLHSIGVCYEGGLDRHGSPCDTRTAPQRQTLWLLMEVLKRYYPNAVVVGHRDLSPDLNGDGIITPNEWVKVCPCFDAKLYNMESPYRRILGNGRMVTIH